MKPQSNHSQSSKLPPQGLTGIYQAGQPRLWSTRLELRPDHTFRYSNHDDVMHLAVEGKWSYEASHIMLNANLQVSDYIRLEEKTTPALTEGERIFIVKDAAGNPAFAEINFNRGEIYFQTDSAGVARGKVANIEVFQISRSSADLYEGPYTLKNPRSNEVMIQGLKPFSSTKNRIFSDEKCLWEGDRVYFLDPNGVFDQESSLVKINPGSQNEEIIDTTGH